MKLDFVHLDDWEGLYVDGVLALSGHRLTAQQVLDELDIPYNWRDAELEELPDFLDEIDS